MEIEISMKDFAAEWKQEIKKRINRLGRTPRLAIVQVGDNEASNRYVRNKVKDCNEVGIAATIYKYEEETFANEYELSVKVSSIAARSDAIIVQLPLPERFKDVKAVLSAIPASKDVDALSGKETFFECCTPLGIVRYLERIKFPFDGSNALIVGRSDLVGKPLAKMLLNRNMTVCVAHSHTKREFLSHAFDPEVVPDPLVWDLIVSAVGKAEMFDCKLARSIVIDVGINFNEEGKMCGDCCGTPAWGWKSPVPGGVGLLTRAALLDNVVKAVEIREEYE